MTDKVKTVDETIAFFLQFFGNLKPTRNKKNIFALNFFCGFIDSRKSYSGDYTIRLAIKHLFIFFISTISFYNCGWGSQPFIDYLTDFRCELGYSAGKYAFLDEGYGELGLFLPIEENNRCYFADLRGYSLSHNKWGSSLGFGFRFKQNSRILGTNLYYDNRGCRYGKFNQIGFGIESLGCYLDFRVNGYLPIGNDTLSSSRYTYDLSNGFLATCYNREFSLQGFDAEVGGHIFNKNNLQAYGAIGPYYYHSKDLENLWGGYARFQLSWRSYITTEAILSCDRINNVHFQGKVMISIPFKAVFNSCNDPWINSLIQPVRRNGIILTNRCCDYTWNW